MTRLAAFVLAGVLVGLLSRPDGVDERAARDLYARTVSVELAEMGLYVEAVAGGLDDTTLTVRAEPHSLADAIVRGKSFRLRAVEAGFRQVIIAP